MSDEFFKFQTKDPKSFKKRAILGNGFFGIDVSNNFGQGFGLTESRDPFPKTYVGGVFLEKFDPKNSRMREELFSSLNNYAIIPKYQDENNLKSSLSEFTQELNMKSAIVTTSGRWGKYNTNTEIFLSRKFVNLGVMRIYCNFNPKNKSSNHVFRQIIKRDPLVPYEKINISEQEKFIRIDGQIKESSFEYNKKGLFNVLQISTIQIFDDEGSEIKYTNKIISKDFATNKFNKNKTSKDKHAEINERKNYDSGKVTEVSDGKIYQVTNEITFSSKKPFSIILYFGIFHDNNPHIKLNSDEPQIYMENAMNTGYEELKKEHIEAWDTEIWKGLITLDNEQIQRQIISSMYAFGCTFKSGYPNSSGPCGLNGYGWGGHVFWDSDLWMNMGSLLWAPELSRCITEFRHRTVEGARQHRINYAKQYNYNHIKEGIKFPWQSTLSGLETSPPGWEKQEHISCDVIFGQHMYYTVTADENYLKEIAFPLVYETCLYLGQRVVKEKDGKYHFKKVIPADEHAFHKTPNDNAFTNLYTATCIGICIDWCEKLNKTYPEHWVDIRDNMFYNFKKRQRRVVEYTGYIGQKIKQADTNLLTFPLEYPFPDDVKRNNMLYYFKKLPKNHIMMSSAIFSTIACELGMEKKAWEYFRDLDDHFHKDQFYIASESPRNDCWPFITGLGGYLASIIFGLGGLRLRKDGLLFSPMIPRVSDFATIKFSKLKFQGVKFEYDVLENGKKFSIRNLGEDCEFSLYFRANRQYTPENLDIIKNSEILTNNEQKVTIIAKHNESLIFNSK